MGDVMPIRTDPRFVRIAKRDYRRFVGPPWAYDLKGAYQFMVCVMLGLREGHSLLDLGCGSLRAGRLFISYLLPGRYCGLEPVKPLIERAIAHEIGEDMIALKMPLFAHNATFDFSEFRREFDMMLCHGLLIHLARPDIGRLFAGVKAHLAPDGIFVGNFQEGKDFERPAAIYPQITRYRPSTIKRIVEDNGLAFVKFDLRDFNPVTHWFVATHPENRIEIEHESVMAFLNQYWASHRSKRNG